MTDGLSRAVADLMRATAQAVILPYYQQLETHQIERKADTPGGHADLVTIADKEAEAMLADGLARLIPNATIVGEEACEADPGLIDRLGDELCWVIDPVDGTNNFGAGHPPFGIIIALAEAGETVAGWIFDPLTQRLCHAVRGGGAWINGDPVRARETGANPPVAAISTIYMAPERGRDVMTRIAGHFTRVETPRCAAEQYPRLVLGINDISLFERTLAWDHAAGVLFANEAGAKVSRLDGSPYRIDDRRTGMIGASSPAMWDRAAGVLLG